MNEVIPIHSATCSLPPAAVTKPAMNPGAGSATPAPSVICGGGGTCPAASPALPGSAGECWPV